MIIRLVTTLPEFFDKPLSAGVVGKGINAGRLHIEIINLRDYTDDKHRSTDDYPFGGGAGMVMLPEPIFKAVRHIKREDPDAKFYLTSPKGKRFDQKTALTLSRQKSITFFCGRYEGVDERVRPLFDEELSIGDFVLSGGEIAALAMVDAVARLIPGVLGNQESILEESFMGPILEYPQYTRPRVFEGKKVPDILLSGNHKKIMRYRRLEALRRTRDRRPDLYAAAVLTEDELSLIKERSL
ncbi:MAG: tRNA (guanosine(37)-N1)-methyltransferase TrmD [Deltaproteobacteria bacterium]|nr:tRNA (guanosine(37)-N1)-methyltransferase TrmD [Deltaproteobacteria bacterium]